jgi:hypothetical protein
MALYIASIYNQNVKKIEFIIKNQFNILLLNTICTCNKRKLFFKSVFL